MKNQIRTIDLIAHFQARIVRFTEIIEREEARWEAEKIEYEKTIWFRWFKQSFAESQREGAFRPSKWDTLWYSKAGKREAEEILQKLEYRTKCAYETTFWDFGYVWDETKFYTWCAENGVPY